MPGDPEGVPEAAEGLHGWGPPLMQEPPEVSTVHTEAAGELRPAHARRLPHLFDLLRARHAGPYSPVASWMTQHRVSLSMIVRDESENLAALLSSVRPHVDEIVVVDTGSTDRTVEVARRWADKVAEIKHCNDDEGRIADFSVARNHALDLCSHDWVLWLDGDDLLGGLPSAIRDLVRDRSRHGRPTSVLLPYEYSYHPNGTPSLVQWRERLVWPRSEFRWSGPVHETLGRHGSSDAVQSTVLVVKHRRQFLSKPQDPGRNLRILEGHVARTGIADVRSLYYLGKELMAAGRHAEAVPHIVKHVDHESWDDSKCQSLLDLSACYLALGSHSEAAQAAWEAALERSWPDPYYQLARVFIARAGGAKDMARAAHFARIGLALDAERADTLLFRDPGEAASMRTLIGHCLASLPDADRSVLSRPLGGPASPTSPEEVKARIVSDLRSLGVEKVDLRISKAESVPGRSPPPAQPQQWCQGVHGAVGP